MNELRANSHMVSISKVAKMQLWNQFSGFADDKPFQVLLGFSQGDLAEHAVLEY
ncbi:hypothetical protein LCGC14_3081800 [marine sediment metagenome]|uniref:Uncharacterized protein n=1 Tax=marine sediment metagenome TaxID=412755 RepID=A0A0F8Z3R1_9ZZZZ